MANKKQKRKDWMKGIFLIIVLFFIAFIVLYIYGYLQRTGDEIVNTSNEYDKIEKYGYVIYDNATDYYKEEFAKLKELENEEDIATQVAKLFAIDLLSIDYKINKYEVTSTQYYYSNKQEMYRQKVLDNFYNFVVDNSYGDRNQDLPNVKEIEVVKTSTSTYELGEEKVDSYVVLLNISYEEDLGYDDNVKITLVKDQEPNISVVAYEAL